MTSISLRHAALALLATTTLGLTSLAVTGHAADLPSRKGAPAAPPVVSACTESEGIPTDAFGFTTGSDVADLGSFGPSLTYGGAYGTRLGTSNSHALMLQGSYGLAPCLEVGPYLLGGFSQASLGGVSADERSFGAGIETKYKILGRDMHGIGLTAVIDPSFNRIDPQGAGRFTTYNTGLRLFADKTLIPGKLYAALNLSHDLTWTGPDPYARSSTFTVGGSLAWQVLDGVYLSGEVRHQRAHNTLGFDRQAGYATFAGPGVFWQATKQFAISAAYNVQVAGKAKGQPGDLDLTNFSQHLVKVKAAYSF
ncbi:hypothetical protein [Bosea vaviloviae]|uniref:Outer membrane protein beta-barrel domain-containing protein n=1 Tax=Bosea vaviloviae TaxID=1526658 RepID=A0A0N1N2W7_9HYPH|nr:hypothetical protein [Bosea vaviloviae]KPH81624.1 hypothetical protein AE618_07750 [Bosea vaviloviae]